MKSKKTLWLALIIAVVVGLVALLWVFLMPNSGSNNSTTSSQDSGQTKITLDQVTLNDGKNGNQCWVVVDGTVYEISGFAKWVDGMHTSSAGKASCGRDLSDTIDESPHGKAKLKLLKEIGKLSQ